MTGRYGYRRITVLLNQEGWRVNHKRVERIWRRESLKVPKKQPKRRRLWMNDGSCIRLRPEYKDHVRSYDFMVERTAEGRGIQPTAYAMAYRKLYRKDERGVRLDTMVRTKQPKIQQLKATRT